MSAPAIDAHQHFLDPGRVDYPWMTPALDPIRRPFGPDDLAPLLAETGIVWTILVEANASLEESRDCLATAAAGFVAGVVGWVDLTDPGVGDAIAALRGGPGGAFLVGIRHHVHDEPDPDWLARRDVRRGLAAVAAAGLAYDLLVRPRELPAAIEVVRAMPDLRFVVDHLAKPPIRTGALDPWARLLRTLGDLPNTWCKLSGLVTEADWHAWDTSELAPYVTHALDVFGPDRLLFGSDWPVCLLAAGYSDVVDVARSLTDSLSRSERSAVFGGNAARVYGLQLPGD